MPHSWSLPWTPSREHWRSAAAAAHSLFIVEVNGKCEFLVGITTRVLNFIYSTFLLGLFEEKSWDKPKTNKLHFSSVQSCLTLCDPMNCSTPGLPVQHQLPESTQTHVHWVGDAIQSSHPLSSPSPPALNLSQHLVLFKWVSSSHQVDKVLEYQLQHQSFQWTPKTDLLYGDGLQDGLVGSCSPRDFQESSPTPQCKSINSWALSFLYSPLSHPYMTTEKAIPLTRWTFVDKIMSLLFNMLSRWAITFAPSSKCLLISWL